MKEYKGYFIDKNIHGMYCTHCQGHALQSDTLKGLKGLINEQISEPNLIVNRKIKR